MRKFAPALLFAALLACAFTSPADAAQDRRLYGDTYGYGSRAGKYDPFTDGAKMGRYDPYADGARCPDMDRAPL